MTQEYGYDRAPNVQQGTIFALAALPLGVVVYVLLYQFGFIASIVGFGVAWLAALLYQYGSGQPVDRAGAVRVSIITLATIVLAVAAGIVWDVAGYWAGEAGSSALAVLFTSDFWGYLVYDLSDLDYFSPYVPDILIGIGFGVAGCFSTLRMAFGRPRRVSRPAPDVAAPGPATPPPIGRYGIAAEDDDR